LSQRHHLLPFSLYGETECTFQLCASCHDLFHLIEKSVFWSKIESTRLLDYYLKQAAEDSALVGRYLFLKKKVELMVKLVCAYQKVNESPDPIRIDIEDEQHHFFVQKSFP
jgi:hypothetical protein